MSIKIPKTKYDVNQLIINRWSARAFSEEPISKEILSTIFEAAAWAPSAMNEQPWRYIAALKDNKEAFYQLQKLLKPGNNAWAKNAAALIFCYTKLTYTQNNKENVNAFHDAGMANQIYYCKPLL